MIGLDGESVGDWGEDRDEDWLIGRWLWEISVGCSLWESIVIVWLTCICWDGCREGGDKIDWLGW